MGSYLITFKPSTESPGQGWPLSELQKLVKKCNENGSVEDWWRFKNSHAQTGDRVYLLCQGKLGPAIIGTGELESRPERRDGIWAARVRFENLVDPTVERLLPPGQLKSIPNSDNYWRTQVSGIALNGTANRIQELLSAAKGRVFPVGTDGAPRLSKLTSPAAVKKAMDEYDRLGQEEFLKKYGFGEARDFLIDFEGRQYDSKAIAGVAYKYEHGEFLPHNLFSGGVSPGGAATKLKSLGFRIIGTKEERGWSQKECEITARAYFACMKEAAANREINKARIYRETSSKLDHRSAKSVEYKFQNIEKILEEEGLPRIGMSTKKNYQKLLRVVVLDLADQEPRSASPTPAQVPKLKSWDELKVEPPKGKRASEEGDLKSARVRGKVVANEQANKELGELGEKLVLALEKDRLSGLGRSDLAKRVKRESETDDSLGYDIRSFDEEGDEIFIEVKTTNSSKESRFFITDNELCCARTFQNKYRLYRLFDFNRDPHFYVLEGPLDEKLSLRAKTYAATCLG
jgi:hypothetical protein